MGHVLHLNADASPKALLKLSAIPWWKAIKRVFEGKATIVDTYSDWTVHSPSTSIAVPSIIMDCKYSRPRSGIRLTRWNVFLRDDFRCQYCLGKFEYQDLTYDHVIPKSRGGKITWENCVAACKWCNLRKGNRLDMIPDRMPYKPTYFELVSRRKTLPLIVRHASWLPYLDWPEDLIVLDTRRANLVPISQEEA